MCDGKWTKHRHHHGHDGARWLANGNASGALDPAAVIYMIRDLGMTPDEAEHTLYEESGLKGLSGLTNDVKALLENNDPKAKFALDYFALKVAQYIAMMAVSAGDIDAIVFTGVLAKTPPLCVRPF